MIAPGIYLIALLLYVGLGMAFCAGCLILALIPKLRSFSLRAAVAMIATFPGVFVYQLLSLPFMAILFVLGSVITALLGFYKEPMALAVFGLVLAGAFGGVSVMGFVSAWRVAWCGMAERSFSAGWRREFLVAAFSSLGRRRPKRIKIDKESHDSQQLLGK